MDFLKLSQGISILFVTVSKFLEFLLNRKCPMFDHISKYAKKRVENTACSGVVLTNLEVFVNVVKDCLQCLIYFVN